MSLTLHVCCADCLLRFLVALGYPFPAPAQKLIQNYSQFPPQTNPSLPTITLYFFNPNLAPKSEYNARLQAVQKISSLLQLPLTVADYRPQAYFSQAAMQTQLQTLQLSPTRCLACQSLRLQQTITHAPDLFSTTMLASPYLDQVSIQALAKNLSPEKFFAPSFLFPPTSIKTSGFYKQNYCGCLFSLLQKSQEKFLQTN